MSFANGYRGTAGGAVQTTYKDQPGVAYPGMLMFASDLNNCDSIFIGETAGIRAGAGIRALAANEGLGMQRPAVAAYLPEGDEAAAEFYGIIVFDEAMQCDENGVPGWAKSRVGRVVRPGRSGGRVYVPVKDAIVPGTSTVNWVLIPDAAGKYERGDFAPAALAGGDAGTSVAITNADWIVAASADGLAGLELFGNVIPVRSTDDESL